MKKIKLYMLLILLALSITSCKSDKIKFQKVNETRFVTTTEPAKVYKNPDMKDPVYDLELGEELTVISESVNQYTIGTITARWKFVNTGKCKGYLFGPILSAPIGTSLWVTSQAGLILRAGPSKNNEKIMTLPYGTKVTFIKENNSKETINGIEGSWDYVSYGTTKGWVFNGYLSESTSSGAVSGNGYISGGSALLVGYNINSGHFYTKDYDYKGPPDPIGFEGGEGFGEGEPKSQEFLDELKADYERCSHFDLINLPAGQYYFYMVDLYKNHHALTANFSYSPSVWGYTIASKNDPSNSYPEGSHKLLKVMVLPNKTISGLSLKDTYIAWLNMPPLPDYETFGKYQLSPESFKDILYVKENISIWDNEKDLEEGDRAARIKVTPGEKFFVDKSRSLKQMHNRVFIALKDDDNNEFYSDARWLTGGLTVIKTNKLLYEQNPHFNKLLEEGDWGYISRFKEETNMASFNYLDKYEQNHFLRITKLYPYNKNEQEAIDDPALLPIANDILLVYKEISAREPSKKIVAHLVHIKENLQTIETESAQLMLKNVMKLLEEYDPSK